MNRQPESSTYPSEVKEADEGLEKVQVIWLREVFPQ